MESSNASFNVNTGAPGKAAAAASGRYPFEFDHARPYMEQAAEWIADVFYELLPEAGFEIRDEQIYMAFQLEKAFAERKTIFAEAGVGTGKTLVYLLYAICYARYHRKPAIIACADESLIEQLAKPEGDLAKLARHLELAIDARLGKSPDQYLCLVKLDQARGAGAGMGPESAARFEEVHGGLPAFVHTPKALQSFYPYGDRKLYPELTDGEWARIGWDPFQDCFVCDRRHRCGQTLSREHYRQSTDLIVCSHDFYMEHVWTYEGRKREGQLPLLPDHCAVVFDEGHLLENAAQKALTYRLKHVAFEQIVTRLLEGEIREATAVLIDEAIEQSEALFAELGKRSRSVAGSDKNRVELDAELMTRIRRFRAVLEAIEEELVFEDGLHTLNEYQLRIVEEHLETVQKALGLFDRPEKPICWTSHGPDGLVFVVMPKAVKQVLRESVFSRGMPIVFSSATLSTDGKFDYMADSLGIDAFLSFSVASPYDYERQMKVTAPLRTASEATFEGKAAAALRLIREAGGRTLLLFPEREELERFKRAAARPGARDAALDGVRFLYEGDGEISRQIADFQRDETSVLSANSLWEGLDIPGPSLSNVIVWSLPYPPADPVFEAKRASSGKPHEEVDLPYMLLRLKQGMGRLIRSREDAGAIALLSADLHRDADLRARVEKLLPDGVALEMA